MQLAVPQDLAELLLEQEQHVILVEMVVLKAMEVLMVIIISGQMQQMEQEVEEVDHMEGLQHHPWVVVAVQPLVAIVVQEEMVDYQDLIMVAVVAVATALVDMVM